MKTKISVDLENTVACEVLKYAESRNLTLDQAIQTLIMDGLDFGKTLPPPAKKTRRTKS